MEELVIHVVTSLGVPGLSIYLLYKLLDRYLSELVIHAGRFVEASIRQSASTADLVAAMRESSTDQREVLLAVRSMSTELTALKGWVRQIEEPTAK